MENKIDENYNNFDKRIQVLEGYMKISDKKENKRYNKKNNSNKYNWKNWLIKLSCAKRKL